jgi:NADPH-dependent glutamate synthase beta subunit-like oxidoreductase/NAD(P)H-flavin reductase
MSFHLAFGLEFQDLYTTAGLSRLDGAFCAELQSRDLGLFNRLMAARLAGCKTSLAESELLIALAPVAEDFIGALFGVTKEIEAQRTANTRLSPIYECKRQFIQRRAAKKFKAEEVAAWTFTPENPVSGNSLDFAAQILFWLRDEEKFVCEIALAERYAAWALHHPDGQAKHKGDVLFKLPRKTDPQHLVPVATEIVDGYRRLKSADGHYRWRDGFKLTDDGGSIEYALDQAHYCIWCHGQSKDSCRTGLRDKKTNQIQKSAHGVALAGCPLDEKISEMNQLRAMGHVLGALAVVAVDNPLCALTGHRICNDCMKSCIYQKQDAVDIPQNETHILRSVLSLPWGFEIYSLLTRWNPLNLLRPVPRPDSGRKILIAGMGPAGINLSHHLLNDGHYVCAIDGLKIEPMETPFAPIRDAHTLFESLDERVVGGFGGVAEYGITVRWDKNFLKIVRLLLSRRAQFDLFGGVRFGGTITPDQAWEIGFDHIALCLGAGRPTLLDIPGNLAKGVRAASDFLMGLQLTGAAKAESLANLQIRLPAVVIGGGLTAIDTATEILAYYPRQVEKFLQRYEQLGETDWNAEERAIADEFISHARLLRKTPPQRRLELLQSWGGVTIAYRRDLSDAPSYTLNHEEVHKALEEGIFIAPNLTPEKIITDVYGWVDSLICHSRESGNPGAEKMDPRLRGDDKVTLRAKTIMVAAGTQPNTVLAREGFGFALDGKYFQAYDDTGNMVSPERSAKPTANHIFMHARPDGRRISFLGDLHPSYAGNVVKAMASAKNAYPQISHQLRALPGGGDVEALRQKLRDGLIATVHAVNRLTPKIIEVVVRAPMAARNFQPGQFYRLQNFETTAGKLAMEGLAMTGAWVDHDAGLLATIVLEMGGSSSLCQYLRVGEEVVLMGPTGMPTDIPKNQKLILAGGGLGNAVLFSIGQAARANGCQVVYFAGYKDSADRFKQDAIEAAADIVVWCNDTGAVFTPGRPQDRSFTGNIIQAMRANADLLAGAGHLIAIGSDRMMAAVAAARPELLPDAKTAIGSINSPMQCMLKEICAQCIQRQIDPDTGAEKIVFSCFNQDQDLASVDWSCLRDRLAQNATQEKLTAKWIDKLMHAEG